MILSFVIIFFSLNLIIFDMSKSSVNSDEIRSKWCHKNLYRLLIIVILIIFSIVNTTSLIIILYKDAMKEKMLIEKKKRWESKWEIISPYVKNFPLGFIVGFIRNLIVLSIERQFEI